MKINASDPFPDTVMKNIAVVLLVFGFAGFSPRNFRSGKSFVAIPSNLVLAVALLVLIAVTWGALLVDQVPCFMDVPNCD